MGPARVATTRPPRSPLSAAFKEDILEPLAARRDHGEADPALRDELLRAILPWIRQQIDREVRRIPTNADPANVSSLLHEAAFQAVIRLDWQQWETWPMYLATLVRRAAQEAARADDYLSRQQRVLRTRFRQAIEAHEARQPRPLTHDERHAIALEIAGGRRDPALLLLMGWHPREVAEVPDEVHPTITIDEQVERKIVRQEVRHWLDNELPESVRDMVLVWLRSPRSQTLPRRLEARLQPFVTRLLTLVDDAEEMEPPIPRSTAGEHRHQLHEVGR